MAKPSRFDWLFRPQLADEDGPLWAELRFGEALAELPAVERSALALSEIGGLDTEEIAERLGTDPVTVGKLLARAREAVRTSLADRRRGGLTALLPFQSLWQLGSAAPAMRAAGAVAATAAVVGPNLLIGGAVSEAQSAPLTLPTPPLVDALEPSHVDAIAPARMSINLAAAPGAAVAEPQEAGVDAERRPVPRVAAPAPQPSPRADPAGEQAAAAPAPRPPAAQPKAVTAVPVPVTPAPTVLLPPLVELPALPAVPAPVAAPPTPLPPPLPLPLP